jgi:hypothetical protein
MRSGIASFCQTCLHCLSTIGGTRGTRPMGHALHADKPNDLIHFDFLYLGKRSTGDIYVLILKDDASGFIWLLPCKSADADTTADALIKWFSMFGVVPTWNSDRASHFKNAVIHRVNRVLHAHHHFTTPYCPQSNGTVETVCKDVLRACRALLSEFRMSEQDWPHILPLLQSTLNQSIGSCLRGRAPITAFTGLPAENPLRTLLPPCGKGPCSIEFVRAQRLIHIRAMETALADIHRDVPECRTRCRDAVIARHNKQTHVQPASFTVGDFVLVAQRIQNDGHKLRVKWSGPKR